ncbi:hypothetical protein K7185_08070 [Clostridium butyricum]|uniref:hypothetical protein n=1 Tax=Clostridium butyricum TaxID=1492 RepID=UPI001CA8A4FA|nr:hypothetical protein [Clostridium butyricum]MBZ0312427.1 hypothetical protein [Clostridium butyricum]
MEENKYDGEIIDVESSDIVMEEISEHDAKELNEVLRRFTESYISKDASVSDKIWLKERFKEELSYLTDDEAEKLSDETILSIDEFDKNYNSVNEVCNKGVSKESWFANKVSEASTGMAINDYGNSLKNIDTAITNGNTQMMRTVTTKAGNISQCRNLDGFIAEQAHVNEFNIKAALEKSNYRAEVCVPEPGQTYGLNSFDTVIKDVNTGKIVHQYQFKFGKDAKATIALLKDGNYNNQRFVVPAEQVKEVREAFPGKSVESYIGGTDTVTLKSQSLTKQQVKELQLDTQQKSNIPSNDWNVYNTKELALNIGKNAGLVGLQSAAITTGFNLAAKAISGEKINGEEVLETALASGADAGIKAATAGALKVGAEKQIIKLIPKGTPVSVIANIACVSIENAKILAKVASGELTMSEALDQMGRTSVSMVYGIGWGATGTAIGAAALSWIPIVGPIVGGLAGGMIGYMAGSKFGSAVYSGVKKVASTAKSVAKSAWNGIKSVGSSVVSGIKSIGRKLFG